MNTEAILKEARAFATAFAIQRIPHGLRIMDITFSLTTTVFLVYLLAVRTTDVGNFLPDSAITIFAPLFMYERFFVPVLLISLSLGLLGIGMNSYRSYYYLRGVRRVFEKNETDITYEVAEIFSRSHPTFSTLLMHKESGFLINRLGLDRDYLLTQFGDLLLPPQIDASLFESHITIGSLWKAMYETHAELAAYMLSQSIKKKTLYKACAWMDRLLESRKNKSAWWWRENLSKVRGFAKILSYGMTGYMSRYAEELVHDPKLHQLGDVILHQEESNQLEEVLAKRHGANAVIVGPEGSGRYTVALALARAIEQGQAYSEIEHKRMFLLKASAFELVQEKVQLEHTIITIFNEAVVARNIIFILDDVAHMVEICKRLDIDFFSLIEPYITHDAVSVVILTDETTASKSEYKSMFESRFETIKMRDLDSELFLPYLEDKSLAIEKSTGHYFTYTALEAIAQKLPVYFVEDAPLVKAGELLLSIAGNVSANTIIKEEDVEGYLGKATGVGQGQVRGEEKEQLLHLEDVLSKNVIGQKEAVSAVAKTMRRIRSGIAGGTKPMGTFLFLGPTGSGKTETAKTLATVFFGSEEHMSRIDMGEYALPNSVSRLLGNENEEGDLARLVHARQYGVLLLDEFEKSAPEVKDLFLRILDEGVFTNGQGKLVSLRTQIIIATSNAGSELIRENSLSINKETVVNSILEQGVFKPELVNRFDATVMFIPLSSDTLKGVAKKKLDQLGARMEDDGYKVSWSEDLIEYIVEHSQGGEFGGRALQRVIQDTVEDALSKKIIEGNLKVGDTIHLSVADLA